MAGGGVRGIYLAGKSSARTFLTPQPHGNIPPCAGNAHMGLRVAGPPWDWEVHSRLPLSGGGGSPTFFSAPPPQIRASPARKAQSAMWLICPPA